MIKVIMTAFVAIAFFATATERGFSPVTALIIGAGAALGVYYTYLRIEEMEAQYEERHKYARRKKEKCSRQAAAEDALSARNGGAYHRGVSNRNTYALGCIGEQQTKFATSRYAQADVVEGLNGKGAKAVRDSDTRSAAACRLHPPIRKVCGVLSYDYYVSKDKERRI